MKRILIVFIFSFVSSFGFDFNHNLNINEWKSDIYYGNGIMTTRAESDKALRKTLIPSIETEIYKGKTTEMNSYHNFAIAYNYSAKEDFGNTPIAMALDLMEANDQLANTSVGWWLANEFASWTIGKVNFVAKYGAKTVSKSLQASGLEKWISDILAGQIVGKGLLVPTLYVGMHIGT